ncbi:MAG: hypothetical protein ABSB60_01245 [Terracidiphilus sp.]|jgi:uncharacterized protein YciI
MKHFFLKLTPPRTDFMWTTTEQEKEIMQAHAAYWKSIAEKGWAVAYGPVAAETGGFGAGFWTLPDDVDPRPVADADPAILANVGFQCEIHPMPALILGKAAWN